MQTLSDDFRVRFETIDGMLLKNRKADSKWYFSYGRPDKEMIDMTLKQECREIGVRMIRYTIDKKKGLHVIVEWLRPGR